MTSTREEDVSATATATAATNRGKARDGSTSCHDNDRSLRHKIRLDGNSMSVDAMIRVLNDLRIVPPPHVLSSPKKRHQATSLAFDEVTFDSDLAAAAMNMLQQHASPVWDRLDLEFCDGGRHVASVLHVALILNKVRHLFLANDSALEVDDVFVTACTVLRVQSSLASLWMLSPLNTRVSTAMSEALSANRTLTKLSLSGSSFESSRAVDALADGLRENDAIRTLDISCCGLSDDLLHVLIASLERHPSLQVLDIGRNFARSRATSALANMLRNPESELHTIDLREQFFREMVQAIAGGSDEERSKAHAEGDHEDEDGDFMTPLDPPSAPADEQLMDISEISRSLQNNERLETLRLSHNQLTDEQVLELAAGLKTNVTLSELDLQWNKISDRGVNAFTTALKDLSGLQVLLLGGNEFGKEGTKILEQLDDDDDSICTVNEHAFKQSLAAKSGGYSLSIPGRRR